MCAAAGWWLMPRLQLWCRVLGCAAVVLLLGCDVVAVVSCVD